MKSRAKGLFRKSKSRTVFLSVVGSWKSGAASPTFSVSEVGFSIDCYNEWFTRNLPSPFGRGRREAAGEGPQGLSNPHPTRFARPPLPEGEAFSP